MSLDTIVTESAPAVETAAAAAAAPATGVDATAAAATAAVDSTIATGTVEDAAAADVVKTPEQIADDAAAAEEAAKAAEGAPEKYDDFIAPEGTELDPAVAGAFAEVARELNLPQGKAQMLIDKVSPIMAARQMEQFEAQRQEWHNQSSADPEFGGAKLPESKVFVARAMKEFSTPEFTKLINDSGFGNHPELVRFMVKAGKAISEEKIITGGVAASTGIRSAADTLYPASSVKK